MSVAFEVRMKTNNAIEEIQDSLNLLQALEEVHFSGYAITELCKNEICRTYPMGQAMMKSIMDKLRRAGEDLSDIVMMPLKSEEVPDLPLTN